MDITKALSVAAGSDTAAHEFLDRKVRELPRTDVIVQRSMLLQAVRELRRYKRLVADIEKVIASGESDIRGIGQALKDFDAQVQPVGEDS